LPALVGIKSIPKVALVPLIILWTGLGVKPAIFTSIVIVIFPIATVVAASVATTDPELRDVLRSLGAGRLVALAKIAVPQSLPFFLSSLKIAVSLSFIGTIVAESVAANRGLGYMMNRAASDFDVELVFSGVAVLAGIGIALYLISVFLERNVAAWAFRRPN
jgi:NitT/TauT family transport system permease protein